MTFTDEGNAIKGVLFDKDGTLIDFHATWMPAYESAVQAVCAESGKPDLALHLLELAGYDSCTQRCDPDSLLACGTTAEIARLWAQESGLRDAEAITVRIEEIFDTEAAARAVPVVGLDVSIEALVEQGKVLGVATMDSEALAHATLNRLGLAQYFSFVCGYDSGFGVKPGPGMVEAFCAHTELTPAQIAVVGDTLHDLNMARAASAGLVIGVLTGASGQEKLDGLADHVLPDIRGLGSLLWSGNDLAAPNCAQVNNENPRRG